MWLVVVIKLGDVISRTIKGVAQILDFSPTLSMLATPVCPKILMIHENGLFNDFPAIFRDEF